MAHGIFRSDSCSYTHDGALIRTAQAYGDIDNGAPILCGGLATTGTFAGEREVFVTSAATGANAADVWVVTSPEHAYTTDMKPLENFYNASGDIARISKLVNVYKSMLEKEEREIAETVGDLQRYEEWMEAVNCSSCHKVIIKDLEKLLEEIEEKGDDGK